MRSLAWARGCAVVAAASMLATACSGGGGGAESKRVTLASVLGVSDSALDTAAVQKQTEELAAQCMIAAGWEYIPVQYPSVAPAGVVSDEDEVARIKREGLGFAYGALYNGADGTGADDPWANFVNPNDAYVASLSEDEKAAYEVSLYGTAEEQAQTGFTTTTFDPTTGTEWSMTGGQSGCQGEAFTAVFAKTSTQTTEGAEAIKRYWEDLQTRVKADPRTIKLGERWASCMSDAGYDYEDPDGFTSAAYSEFSSKVSAVTGTVTNADPTAGWTPEQLAEYEATHTQEEVDALFSTQTEFTADQRKQLEAILAEEVVVALADHACTASLKDESAAIYADVEERYALEHSDELTALAASMAGEGS